jgi:hypothetical protein
MCGIRRTYWMTVRGDLIRSRPGTTKADCTVEFAGIDGEHEMQARCITVSYLGEDGCERLLGFCGGLWHEELMMRSREDR